MQLDKEGGLSRNPKEVKILCVFPCKDVRGDKINTV